MFDILTIGAGTRDVFLVSKEFKFIESSVFSTGVGECVALGAKIELDQIVHSTGGGATNAATTFARLGFKTAAICRVGDDGAGRDVIADMHREGVDTSLIQRVRDGVTGYSTLLTAATGERTALVFRGVSGGFTEKDIPWKDCAASWLYLTSVAGNMALNKRIIAYAKRCEVSLAWNPGSKELAAGMRAMHALLPHVRVLNMNREEAERLTKKTTVPEMLSALSTPKNTVLITDGQVGAYASQNGKKLFVGTRNVKAISRTGAGDAFGSGFVAGYLKTDDLRSALAIATLNAESVIREVGAKAGILRKWPSTAQIKSIPIKQLST